MLPRDRRVRTPAEFRHLRRTGTRAGRRTVVVSVATDPDQTRSASPSAPRPRAGFVVSKAVGNAVTRNRVKRRLRAVLAEQMRAAPLRQLPVLVQVRALPPAAEADHARLRRETSDALEKALRPHLTSPSRGEA